MAKLEEALDFLKDDLSKAEKQWEGTSQMMSLLQRESVNYDSLKNKFDPADDENKWCQAYGSPDGNTAKLQLYRKRMSFLKASRKEFSEEYNDKVTDCDFMRLLEVPYTDSRYVIEFSKLEMKD